MQGPMQLSPAPFKQSTLCEVLSSFQAVPLGGALSPHSLLAGTCYPPRNHKNELLPFAVRSRATSLHQSVASNPTAVVAFCMHMMAKRTPWFGNAQPLPPLLLRSLIIREFAVLQGPQQRMDGCWEPAGLPEAIWRQIASHLSVKEYAQMAVTCKVFSEVLPQLPVCIDSRITDGGMAPMSTTFPAVDSAAAIICFMVVDMAKCWLYVDVIVAL